MAEVARNQLLVSIAIQGIGFQVADLIRGESSVGKVMGFAVAVGVTFLLLKGLRFGAANAPPKA